MDDNEEERTVWCGNLSEKVTHDILYELFYQAGPLERVRIPRSNDGQQRNFGFVTYVHRESVPYAVELFRGTVLFDRDLRIRMQNGARGNNNSPSTDLAMLLGRPLVNGSPNIDQNVEQKFISMTNQMMINGGFRNLESNFGTYDQTSNPLSGAAQSHWASRHNNGRDRRKHEPYRRRDRSDDRRGRDRDRGDKDRNGDRGGMGYRERDWQGDRRERNGRGNRY